MTAPQLIEHAAGLGVSLWRDGDSLGVRGPADKLSQKTLQRLAELKPVLLPLLPTVPPVSGLPKISQSEAPPGAWRSSERIAQERIWEKLATGEALAVWPVRVPGFPHPSRWLREEWQWYCWHWWQAERAEDPEGRKKSESEREHLFESFLGLTDYAVEIRRKGQQGASSFAKRTLLASVAGLGLLRV